MNGNYDYKNLPPFVNGELSPETWNEERRKEILELFRAEEYGRILDESSLSVACRVADSAPGFMDGRAVRKIVEVTAKRGSRELIFHFVVFIPNSAEKKPVPAILTLVNRSLDDADPQRKILSPFWPAEMMIARGYAAAAIFTHEIAPDYAENFSTRFYRLFPEYVSGRPADAGGALAAWAWGMARAVDYLAAEPLINAGEIAIAGHSRGGKAALWHAAQDPRVALAIASCSGCSGAAISRGKAGERVGDIASRFPFWFCGNYRKYAGREDSMPFDQHLLLALIAPRPLYLSDKTLDAWCDPRAEYESLRQVSAVYRVFGKTGGLDEKMPGPEQGIVAGSLGFHFKSGAHNMDEYDWARYLDFCDRHFHPGI